MAAAFMVMKVEDLLASPFELYTRSRQDKMDAIRTFDSLFGSTSTLSSFWSCPIVNSDTDKLQPPVSKKINFVSVLSRHLELFAVQSRILVNTNNHSQFRQYGYPKEAW